MEESKPSFPGHSPDGVTANVADARDAEMQPEPNKPRIRCKAPHELCNELHRSHPESGDAARLQEQPTAELAAHAPPPLINKAQAIPPIPKLSQTRTKKNSSRLARNPPLGRPLASGLSEADKKKLLPLSRSLKNGPANGVTNGGSELAPNGSVGGSAPPAKVAKTEKINVLKIAPHELKAKFNNLLKNHEVMKLDFESLKEKHDEVTEKYEKVKETALSFGTERDQLKQKLLALHSELGKKSEEYDRFKIEKTEDYDRLKIDYDILKHENEDLHRKTKLLEETTSSLKKKSEEFDKLQTEFDDLMKRQNSLIKVTEALRVLSEHLNNHQNIERQNCN